MEDIEGKIYNLSIYLLKETVKTFDGALKSLSVKKYAVKKEYNIEGTIYIGRPKNTQALWKDLLQEAVAEKIDNLDNVSNRALMLLKISNRIYAITFGYGKHLLKDNVIDRDISLKTALNLIDADSLRSMDRANLDNLNIFTKTQSSSKAKQENFNVDPIKDLLKGVTGGVIDANKKILGPNVTGSDGLYINPSITFKDIKPILELITRASSSKKYQEKFDWIDNLKQEKDPGTIDALQAILLDDLIKSDTKKISLSPNVIITWETFEGISYTPRGELQQDFNIESFYEKNRKVILNDWKHFQSFRIYLKFSDRVETYNFPLWRCINYETIYNDFLYVLMGGIWYKINKSYADEIKSYAKDFEESGLKFIDCKRDANEGDYNIALAKSNTDFYLLDKKLVGTNFLRSQIEVCDVLSNNRELIHVKFYRDSAGLSHLFSQGRISANLLMKDESFRKNLRSKLNNDKAFRDLFPLNSKDFNRNDFTITFAIIDEKKRSFVETLPFFSLLNFRLTAEELSSWGYNVKVKKINIV